MHAKRCTIDIIIIIICETSMRYEIQLERMRSDALVRYYGIWGDGCYLVLSMYVVCIGDWGCCLLGMLFIVSVLIVAQHLTSNCCEPCLAYEA